jgi:hypothetical protein
MNPGYYQNIPASRYHADPCEAPSLSSSIAHLLLRESPRKAWHSHPRLNGAFQEEQDAKFDLGTCVHAVLLEDDSSRIEVIDPEQYPSKNGSIPEGWTNTNIRAARDAARAAGKTPLLKRHYGAVQAMVMAAKEFIAKSEISEYWFDAESEVTGICQDKGVWLRARFDRIAKSRRVIMDYKSTTDASPDTFSRQIIRMGHHRQDAFYRRVARILGSQKPEFVFVAQSIEPPHECSLHGCDPALREIADAEIERAIGIWRDCMRTKVWPSYDGRIHWTVPTTWQMNEHELRIAEAA